MLCQIDFSEYQSNIFFELEDVTFFFGKSNLIAVACEYTADRDFVYIKMSKFPVEIRLVISSLQNPYILTCIDEAEWLRSYENDVINSNTVANYLNLPQQKLTQLRHQAFSSL